MDGWLQEAASKNAGPGQWVWVHVCVCVCVCVCISCCSWKKDRLVNKNKETNPMDIIINKEMAWLVVAKEYEEQKKRRKYDYIVGEGIKL